jgi:regulator of replication initiation timing
MEVKIGEIRRGKPMPEEFDECPSCGCVTAGLLSKEVAELLDEIDALRATLEDRDKMHAEHVLRLESERMRLITERDSYKTAAHEWEKNWAQARVEVGALKKELSEMEEQNGRIVIQNQELLVEVKWLKKANENLFANIQYRDSKNDDTWERIAELSISENKTLKAQCSRYKEALESIASKHRPRHEKEGYWLAIDHASCATVLATDTKIARNALKEPQEETKDE